MRENFVAMKRERVAPGKILLRMRWRGYDRLSCRSARTGRRRERYEGRDVGVMEGREPGSRCRDGIDYRCKGVARSGDPVARRCDEIRRPPIARHVVMIRLARLALPLRMPRSARAMHRCDSMRPRRHRLFPRLPLARTRWDPMKARMQWMNTRSTLPRLLTTQCGRVGVSLRQDSSPRSRLSDALIENGLVSSPRPTFSPRVRSPPWQLAQSDWPRPQAGRRRPRDFPRPRRLSLPHART